MTNIEADSSPPPTPELREAFWYWLKLGFISFGGPAGQIAMMHQELVEKKRWISEKRFLHALNYCMVLPLSLIHISQGLSPRKYLLKQIFRARKHIIRTTIE